MKPSKKKKDEDEEWSGDEAQEETGDVSSVGKMAHGEAHLRNLKASKSAVMGCPILDSLISLLHASEGRPPLSSERNPAVQRRRP